MPNKLHVPEMWSAQMGAVIAQQNELAADAYSTDQTFQEMRAAYTTERAFWNQGGPRPYSTREDNVETPGGSVRVRMHRPTADPVLPVIVFIHGGGYVLGDLDTHDRISRTLAEKTGAAVLAVDYTLSPEARFPQAVRECVAVVQELRAHAAQWGIDAGDISFAGDSGGANLSFATYLWLRDELGEASGIRAMLLFYGAYGLVDSESMRLFGGEWDGLDEADYAYYMNMYTRSVEDLKSPYFNILGADLTRDVPPCFIAAAALDPLRDDSRTLNAMLSAHGTPTHYEEVPGVIHGFLHHSRMLDATVRVLDHACAFHRALARPSSGTPTAAGQAPRP